MALCSKIRVDHYKAGSKSWDGHGGACAWGTAAARETSLEGAAACFGRHGTFQTEVLLLGVCHRRSRVKVPVSEKEREEPGAEISISTVGGSAHCPLTEGTPGTCKPNPDIKLLRCDGGHTSHRYISPVHHRRMNSCCFTYYICNLDR